MFCLCRAIKHRLSFAKGNEISQKNGINTLKWVKIPIMLGFALINFAETISSVLYRTSFIFSD